MTGRGSIASAMNLIDPHIARGCLAAWPIAAHRWRFCCLAETAADKRGCVRHPALVFRGFLAPTSNPHLPGACSMTALPAASTPEVLEPMRCQLGVAHGVLDVFVPEPGL
jgi:hypothetical protein